MIEVMDETSGQVLGLRASGHLSRADYRDVLVPRTELLLQQFPTVNVLFLMDEGFKGWSLGAAWDNTVFSLRHRRELEKVAMVGGPKWEEWCVKTGATWLVKGELRTFRLDQLPQAWEWLRA